VGCDVRTDQHRRSRAAYVERRSAEVFQRPGKRVLLLLDSVTRFARALRDVDWLWGSLPHGVAIHPRCFLRCHVCFEAHRK